MKHNILAAPSCCLETAESLGGLDPLAIKSIATYAIWTWAKARVFIYFQRIGSMSTLSVPSPSIKTPS